MSNCGIENGNNYINNSNSSTFNLSPEIKSPLAQSTFIEIEPENYVINSTQLSVEMSNEQIESSKELCGRRIVDMNFVFKQILNCRHKGGLDCTFLDMELISEHRKGFFCSWLFKCLVCQIKIKIDSENTSETEYVGVNKAAVSGSIAIGIGHTQLNEFSATIDVPYISPNVFIKLQSNIGEIINETAWDEIYLAGIEEKKLAIEDGNLNSDGVPMITVVADGSWCKRSYKTKYSYIINLTIIGFRTKKILFIGIRNRYCLICERSKNKNTISETHNCFLNWKGTSTGVEADAIAEGFAKSIEMHGLIYNKLIGDGDSSVCKRLHQTLPYGPKLLVDKIECLMSQPHIEKSWSKNISINQKY
ncbi:unnamed protein product [Macrosiphum euphorbiae]|uniref:Mutator-like transposase domain-containing protein n=1 Tax=Macrosiphum euphorbiae TaxID=13131 RepID=A0AAV0Y964_9HEMI|nr:unnamed protein product [Macrosiphum euphorbiae]